MKRTREKIVTQSLPVYVRNQKRNSVLKNVMPPQMNVSGISLIRIYKIVYLNLYNYNCEFIGW